MHCCTITLVAHDHATARQHGTNRTSWRSDCTSSWTWRHACGSCHDICGTPVLITMRRPWVAQPHTQTTQKSLEHTHDTQHCGGASHDQRQPLPLVTQGDRGRCAGRSLSLSLSAGQHETGKTNKGSTRRADWSINTYVSASRAAR